MSSLIFSIEYILYALTTFELNKISSKYNLGRNLMASLKQNSM